MSMSASEMLKELRNTALKRGRTPSSLSYNEIDGGMLIAIVDNTDELCRTLKETNAHLRAIALSLASYQVGRQVDNSDQRNQQERTTQS